MAVLIIGASGYIGNEIFNWMRNEKHEKICIGTKLHYQDSNLVKFDILNDDIYEIDRMFVGKEKYALICAADANIEYCLANREEAYQKNVISTIRLINQLKNLDYHITFLSTDNVFDGEKGSYSEKDIASPINEYGKMKREVETYIMSKVLNSCIMRIGKTVGDFKQKNDLLVEWYNKALNNEIIPCIKDNVFNISYVKDLARCYSLIIEKKLTGIYHIVNDESNSRKELCENFLNFVGMKAKIVEKDISQFNFCEKRPRNISMDNTKFIMETGFEFQKLESIWKKFLDEYILQ